MTTLVMAAFSPAIARDQINIVGSSTVFPFSTTVAERFGKSTDFKTPVVESTGSGGGLKLFCAGVGVDTPDITNASRRIKPSEVAQCAENGVTETYEVGAGKALTGMIRRIHKEMATATVGTPVDVANAAAKIKG